MNRSIVIFSLACLLAVLVTSRPFSSDSVTSEDNIGYQGVVDMIGGKKKHKKHRSKPHKKKSKHGNDYSDYGDNEDDEEEEDDNASDNDGDNGGDNGGDSDVEAAFNSKERLSHNSINDDSGDEMSEVLEDVADKPVPDGNRDRGEDDLFVKKRELYPVYLSQLDESRRRKRASDEDGDMEYREKSAQHDDYIDSDDKDYGDDLLPDKRQRREDSDAEDDTLDDVIGGSTRSPAATTSEIYIPVPPAENDLDHLIERSKAGEQFDEDRVPVGSRLYDKDVVEGVEDYDLTLDGDSDGGRENKDGHIVAKSEGGKVAAKLPPRKHRETRDGNIARNHLKANTMSKSTENNKIVIPPPTTMSTVKKRQIKPDEPSEFILDDYIKKTTIKLKQYNAHNKVDSSLDANNVGDAPGNQLDDLGEYGTEEELFSDSQRDQAEEQGETLDESGISNKKRKRREKAEVKREVADDSDNQATLDGDELNINEQAPDVEESAISDEEDEDEYNSFRDDNEDYRK